MKRTKMPNPRFTKISVSFVLLLLSLASYLAGKPEYHFQLSQMDKPHHTYAMFFSMPATYIILSKIAFPFNKYSVPEINHFIDIEKRKLTLLNKRQEAED